MTSLTGKSSIESILSISHVMKANFRKVCLGNLLIFVSLYMLIPILPLVVAEELDLSVAATGMMFPVMVLGMILIGPFCNYFMDAYKRKSLCISTFSFMLVAAAGYSAVENLLDLLLLCLVQGLAFGVGNSSVIALSIDVNVSDNRSRGNIIFGWFTRLGMILGAGLGTAVYLNFNYGFETLIMVSVITGCAGVMFVAAMRMPFRAPIGMPLCSIDRFFLPRTFPFALNVILIAFVPGVLLPLVHVNMNDIFLPDGWAVPYFGIAGGAFLLSVFPVRLLSKSSLLLQALLGMTAVVCAISSLILFDSVAGQVLSAILLGAGLSVIIPAFLYFFINLSSHCQRSTANVTHLLSWETGVSAGLAVAWTTDSSAVAFRAALIASVLAAVFFVGVSYPYYRKKKVR